MATRGGPLGVYLSKPLAVLDSLQELRLGTLAVRTSADRRTSVVRLTPFCSPTAVPLLRRSHVVLPRIPPVVAGVSAVRAGLYTVWTRNVPIRSATRALLLPVRRLTQVVGRSSSGRPITEQHPVATPRFCRATVFSSGREGAVVVLASSFWP